VLTCWCACL